jgi:hypothetical protein
VFVEALVSPDDGLVTLATYMRIIPPVSPLEVSPSVVLYTDTRTDVDINESIVWSLSGTDAEAFDIATNGDITLKTSTDLEIKSSYDINVITTNSDGLVTSNEVTLTNINEVPLVTSLPSSRPQLKHGELGVQNLPISIFEDAELGSGSWNTVSIMTFSPSVQNPDIPEFERVDYSNWYFFIKGNGELLPPVNKFAKTIESKAGGAIYINERQLNCIGQIYVPFIDGALSESAFRITYNPEVGYKCNLPVTNVVDNVLFTYKMLANLVLPRVLLDKTTVDLNPNQMTTVQVKLVDGNGNTINKNTTLYLEIKSDIVRDSQVQIVGSVSDSQVQIVNGVGSFDIIASNSVPNDNFRVKVNWKFYSGVAETLVTVVNV